MKTTSSMVSGSLLILLIFFAPIIYMAPIDQPETLHFQPTSQEIAMVNDYLHFFDASSFKRLRRQQNEKSERKTLKKPTKARVIYLWLSESVGECV